MTVLRNKFVSIEISNIETEDQLVIFGDLNIRSLNLWTSDFLTNHKTLNESLFELDFPRYKPFHVPSNIFFPVPTFISHMEEYNIVINTYDFKIIRVNEFIYFYLRSGFKQI